MIILITGANGQLGQALRYIEFEHNDCKFIFKSSQDLDITNQDSVNNFFDNNKIDVCVNTAAYTAVDKAESESEKAISINVIGPKNLALACQRTQTKLIHISTDFVFDGSSDKPYLETDIPNPLSVYGQTKLYGEQEIITYLNEYFIIRTSWLYSQFGNNFMKTMLRFGMERDTLSIVNDQIGSPTNAIDLANAIMTIAKSDSNKFGVYHFRNEGTTSWYDFAKEIFKVNKIDINVEPISTEEYPTPAIRPKYSVLNTTKIKETFNINIDYWQQALQIK